MQRGLPSAAAGSSGVTWLRPSARRVAAAGHVGALRISEVAAFLLRLLGTRFGTALGSHEVAMMVERW